jgi:hypothetical protein
MTQLVNVVMQVAAIELFEQEVEQIDLEVKCLLAQAECAPRERSHGTFERLMQLLKRRGDVVRKTCLMLKAPRLARPRPPEPDLAGSDVNEESRADDRGSVPTDDAPQADAPPRAVCAGFH